MRITNIYKVVVHWCGMNIVLPIISAIVVSLVSVIAILPLMFKKKIPERLLLFLLSISVGVLLAIVFVDFVPELLAHSYTIGTVLYIIGGFLLMFIIEKFVHSHHHHHGKHIHHHDHGHDHDVECHVHGHAYHLAPLNLIGEGFHNFIDGLVIAGSYAVSIPLGIGATISIVLHEIPMEVADFGILLYAGLSKTKALVFNLLSALTAIAGVVVGMVLIDKISAASGIILAIATGNFLYIAASSLVPQLHRHHSLKDSIMHVIAIMLGVAIIIFITLYGPAHGH